MWQLSKQEDVSVSLLKKDSLSPQWPKHERETEWMVTLIVFHVIQSICHMFPYCVHIASVLLRHSSKPYYDPEFHRIEIK